MLASAFSQSQKSNVAAISAAGAVGRVETRIAAWEKHDLPLIIDRLPAYVPQDGEDREAMEAETPLYTPAEVIHVEDASENAMHEDHNEVTALEGGTLHNMQELSLRNQRARAVVAPTTGAAILPFRTRK